ncbi:MAG: pilus assembly protein [Deltaproteobacteria bacterium]|nr:pilus assembly protein [Deltaproteobacteria bacterium]
MREDERGQALVIGAIALLAVAIMVLASVAVGNGVYQKIKLQDAADAQAYTTAVKEARAYNFFAYTNRAMVVHYCAMLTFMSYLSHAYYLKNTVGRAAGVLQYVPYIGAVFVVVKQLIDRWMDIVDALTQALVPILTALNIALWLAQEAMLAATSADLALVGTSTALEKTDPKALPYRAMSQGGVSGAIGALQMAGLNFLNADAFLRQIDDVQGVDRLGITTRGKLLSSSANKLSDEKMFKYRELMGNIANSARRRWTAVGKGPTLIGRKWSINLLVIKVNKRAMSEIKSFSERFENNRRDQLFASEDIRIKLCGVKCKTKFTYHIGVAADHRDGYHTEGIGMWASKTAKHHPWLGITPFMLSRPTFGDPHLRKFGQPNNLVVVTKDMIGKRGVWELKSRSLYGWTGEFEDSGTLNMSWDRVGGNSGIAVRHRTGGMMALSNARAVYHRPLAWREEPNFFNPLWEARLAPLETNPANRMALFALIPEYQTLRAVDSRLFNY